MSTPVLSVIVPVRNSAETIAACVTSLLQQSLTDLEVIVVGDIDDSSWAVLEHLDDPRLRREGLDLQRNGALRDANIKRCHGLELARGRFLALTDSDMILPEHWAQQGLQLLVTYPVAGGGMISTSDGFVGRYVDTNAIAAKTPRSTRDYLLTQASYGTRGHKPPITASLFLCREVYEAAGGPQLRFTRSYEDYEWARRIIDAGFEIFMTSRVDGHHHHRIQPNRLLREYRRSGLGASDYLRAHPHCRFGRARALQALMVIALALGGIMAMVLAPVLTLMAGALACASVCTLSLWRLRRIEAISYPFLTLLLGSCYWYGLMRGLLGPDAYRRPAPRVLSAISITTSVPVGARVPRARQSLPQEQLQSLADSA